MRRPAVVLRDVDLVLIIDAEGHCDAIGFRLGLGNAEGHSVAIGFGWVWTLMPTPSNSYVS